jgi:hypothetical protein
MPPSGRCARGFLGRTERGQDAEVDDAHGHAHHGDREERADIAGDRETAGERPEQPREQETDREGRYQGEGEASEGGEDAHAVGVPVPPAAQHPDPEHGLEEIGDAVGAADAGREVLAGQEQEAEHDQHGEGDQLREREEERGTGVAHGEERALHEEHDAEADGADHVERDHQPELARAGRMLREDPPERQGDDDDGRRGEQHEHGASPHPVGEVTPQLRDVARGRMLRHPREVGGRHRDGDHRVRQHEDEPGGLQGGDGRADRERRDVRLHEADQLRDEDDGEHPVGDLRRLAQADAAPAEVEPEAEARLAPGDEQDERLPGDPEARAAGEEGDRTGRPVARGAVHVDAVDGGVGEQAGDGDHVVEHGRPGERTEHLLGVQDLAEHRVQAVEEDLGQTPERERDGESERGALRRRGAGRVLEGVDAHDDRGEPHRDHRHAAEQHDAQREELVDVALAAVVGRADGTHDLRHQDRVEGAAGDDRVDVVRQLVGEAEHVGADAAGDADGLREHDRLHEAEQARDHRAGGEGERGAADAAPAALRVSHPRRPSPGGGSRCYG